MSSCRSCSAPIKWARTVAGKHMPLDVEPRPDGNVILVGGSAVVITKDTHLEPDEVRYVAHWATCTSGFEHKRLRRP